jgi:hypothetical protein
MERWKKIEGFLYEVSDQGRIRNRAHEILSPFKIRGGFRAVFLFNGHYHLRTVHGLVANAFIDNPGKKRFVKHKDKNPDHNMAYNLEWSKGGGIKKLTEIEADHIRDSKLSYKLLQEIYGVSKSTVQKIKQGAIWKSTQETR